MHFTLHYSIEWQASPATPATFSLILPQRYFALSDSAGENLIGMYPIHSGECAMKHYIRSHGLPSASAPPSPSAIASFLLRNPSLYVSFLCAVFWHQSSLPLGYMITWWGDGECKYVGVGCCPIPPIPSLLFAFESKQLKAYYIWIVACWIFLFSTNEQNKTESEQIIINSSG